MAVWGECRNWEIELEMLQANAQNAVQKSDSKTRIHLTPGFLPHNGHLQLYKLGNKEIMNIFILRLLWRLGMTYCAGG